MVYVDPLFNTAAAGRRWPYSWACHMWADAEAELHEFARCLGLRPSWAQYVASGLHYDLTRAMRERAVRRGAQSVGHDVLLDHMKRRHGTLGIRARS